MEKMESYDLAILGAGPGGYMAAIRASQLGLKTAVIDKRETPGGTCLNVGCIPSKALLSSTRYLLEGPEALAIHGITTGPMKFDLKKMMGRKVQTVNTLTTGIASLLRQNKVALFFGEGSFKKSGEVAVRGKNGENFFTARNFLIATGSVPAELPFLPFDRDKILDSTGALSLSTVPAKLLVIGAGPIGLELGSIWSRLGSTVSIIEIMPEILPGWDKQTASTLRRILKKQGISFHLKTKITGKEILKEKVLLTGENSKGDTVLLEGDKVLVAAGRKPFCPEQIKNEFELRLNTNGSISVDSNYLASGKTIYAVGDCTPGPMLAHKAGEEGMAAAEIIAGKPDFLRFQIVPSVVYTSPEASSVGQTEEELLAEGIPFSKGVFPMRANGKAVASGNTDGFVKVLSHQKTDRILGVHILGEGADSLIGEAAAVIEMGGSAEDLGRTIHAHPTFSEALKEASLAAYDRAVHIFNPGP